MRPDDPAYKPFGLVRDMLATTEIIAGFDPDQAKDTASAIASAGKLFFTGEGSSRLFPTKHAILQARRKGLELVVHTEAGRQAQEYDLDDWAVLALSNSGRTSEVIKLYNTLRDDGHQNLYSLTAFAGSKLESLAAKGYVLTCGKEGAVAATKSVVEQALFCQSLIEHAAGQPALKSQLEPLAESFHKALTMRIREDHIAPVVTAPTIYFAGRNDGVAEELALKTNEITRKRSDYLEGTYAVHGVEEVMTAADVVIWIDPYEDYEEKFADVLEGGVGVTVIAIASRPTRFPTIQVPDAGDLSSYVMMAAGWNLLVEAGLKLDIDLDKPQRARKVGNEFEG